MHKLDSTATIKRVKELLADYHHFKNLSKRLAISGETAINSQLLRAPLQSAVSALQFKLKCDNTLRLLSGDERLILELRYFEYGNNDDHIMREVNLSKSTYTRRKNSACLSFAKLFGLIELQVYEIVPKS